MNLKENETFRNQIEECTNILQSAPNDCNALNKRGVYRFYLNDYDGALDDYKTAVKKDSKFIKGYFNIARLYQDQREYEKALDNYKLAIEHNPMFAEVYCNIGIIYTEMDKRDLAI